MFWQIVFCVWVILVLLDATWGLSVVCHRLRTLAGHLVRLFPRRPLVHTPSTDAVTRREVQLSLDRTKQTAFPSHLPKAQTTGPDDIGKDNADCPCHPRALTPLDRRIQLSQAIQQAWELKKTKRALRDALARQEAQVQVDMLAAQLVCVWASNIKVQQ